MSASKVIVIGLLMQLCAVASSLAAPRAQAALGKSNLGLLVVIVVLAQILPLYACLGLVLPRHWRVGGLRSEAEMYIAAAWFGTVST
jgi:UMF1 family MFS transporter